MELWRRHVEHDEAATFSILRGSLANGTLIGHRRTERRLDFQYPPRIVSQWNTAGGLLRGTSSGFQYPPRIVSQWNHYFYLVRRF